MMSDLLNLTSIFLTPSSGGACTVSKERDGLVDIAELMVNAREHKLFGGAIVLTCWFPQAVFR
jgi:hypothetical protein